MSFPLIIKGYEGRRCASCPLLQWTEDYTAQYCTLFGELKTNMYGEEERAGVCIRMEIYYKEKKND